MKLSEFKEDIYGEIIQQAKNCIEHEDVSGCCRILLPIIEFHCSHYDPLPQEVTTLLMECSYIDEKHLVREREPRMEELTFSSQGIPELY
jgi:hypothetical protein